jgi:hypothetical protein
VPGAQDLNSFPRLNRCFSSGGGAVAGSGVIRYRRPPRVRVVRPLLTPISDMEDVPVIGRSSSVLFVYMVICAVSYAYGKCTVTAKGREQLCSVQYKTRSESVSDIIIKLGSPPQLSVCALAQELRWTGILGVSEDVRN